MDRIRKWSRRVSIPVAFVICVLSCLLVANSLTKATVWFSKKNMNEIEISHKLPCGKVNLSEGNTILFCIEAKPDGAELKITLTGAETGTILEGSVTGSGELSFEVDITDEYAVALENCSLRGVKFTIDYSIGGSI